jgi:hypothetical protein
MEGAPRTFELVGPQRALYAALCNRHPKLGSMYLGALMVLRQDGNPERLALASHNFRELMEKLPRYADLPAALPTPPTRPGGVKDKVQQLGALWKRAATKSRCHRDGNWSGEIDSALVKFLAGFGEFYSWFEDEIPTVKKAVGEFLRRLDPARAPLPQTIEVMRIQEWRSCEEFFIAVSHHGKETTDSELNEWVIALERFLLERLIPRTFEDYDLIDALIKEGEGRGQS